MINHAAQRPWKTTAGVLKLTLGRKLLLPAAAITALSGPIAIGLLNASPSHSQSQNGAHTGFEVASIKPNTSGDFRFDPRGIQTQPGGRFVATLATAKMLILFAYRIPDSQLFGGPNWITSDHFDVDARASGESGIIPADRMRP